MSSQTFTFSGANAQINITQSTELFTASSTISSISIPASASNIQATLTFDASTSYGEHFKVCHFRINDDEATDTAMTLAGWSETNPNRTVSNSKDVSSLVSAATTSMKVTFRLQDRAANSKKGYTFSSILLTVTCETNEPPTKPGSITVPATLNAGSAYTISWGASTDANNNLAGYELCQAINGTGSYSKIYMGASTSKNVTIQGAWSSVQFAVRAYDSEGVYSDYSYSSNKTVNHAPAAPASITVPSQLNAGSAYSISWGAATDSENNLSGYVLQRAVNGSGSFSQVYSGAATSVSETMDASWSSVQYRVQACDSGGLYSGFKTSGNVTVNHAPGVPASISVPSVIMGGSSITVSWGTATDQDGNLSGYKLEKSTGGSSSFTQIYSGSGTSYTDSINFGTASVTYRVRAYDSYGVHSGYKTSSNVSVINNTAPSIPASITVPDNIKGGSSVIITWKASTDAENNLQGYKLQRSVNSGAYAQVYAGTALTYTDSITKGWNTVQYRVQAYDPYTASDYRVSAVRTVNNNSAPVITCSHADGSSLGTKNTGFSVTYSVNDEDSGDSVTVTEKLDGKTVRSYTASKGASQSFSLTGINYMQVLNGSHTMRIEASDGKEMTKLDLAFAKLITHAEITLKQAIAHSTAITACALSVSGDIPAGTLFTALVTNNANDPSPVWEDCTIAVRNGRNHIFTNKTAANGFAFNFRVTADRGTSGGGYITSIQGGFQ